MSQPITKVFILHVSDYDSDTIGIYTSHSRALQVMNDLQTQNTNEDEYYIIEHFLDETNIHSTLGPYPWECISPEARRLAYRERVAATHGGAAGGHPSSVIRS